MLYSPIAATLFYGSFAAFAVLATWGKEGRAQVGIVLALCWVASNALWWAFPIEWRPAVFPILDVLFALTAAKAGRETGSSVPLALISLSVLAIIANTAFSISGAIHWRQIAIYEISLNVIFVIQCLITGGWGVADALGRIVRFGNRTGGVRRHSKSYRRPAGNEAAPKK